MKPKAAKKTRANGLSWFHEEEQEKSGHAILAGVDEAGRGCWAGPVVAGAVIFHERLRWPEGLNDSKKLRREDRKRLYEELSRASYLTWAVGLASAEEIDRLDILGATILAMRRAVEGLARKVDFLLVDGLRQRRLDFPHKGIVGGDAISPSIAAASILAKESRDRMMEELHADFPEYGFAEHKGYGTAQHQEALKRLGPMAAHRLSFEPVRQPTFSFY